MSRIAGESLPTDVLARLQPSDVEAQAEEVLLALTVDDGEWPHVTMLSHLEVVAIDAQRIRAAVFASSSLLRHVRRTGRLTLVLVTAGLACYIKCDARVLAAEIPGADGLTAIDARVRLVLIDETDSERDGAGTLVSGIRYRRVDPAADMARARALLGALAALSEE